MAATRKRKRKEELQEERVEQLFTSSDSFPCILKQHCASFFSVEEIVYKLAHLNKTWRNTVLQPYPLNVNPFVFDEELLELESKESKTISKSLSAFVPHLNHIIIRNCTPSTAFTLYLNHAKAIRTLELPLRYFLLMDDNNYPEPIEESKEKIPLRKMPRLTSLNLLDEDKECMLLSTFSPSWLKKHLPQLDTLRCAIYRDEDLNTLSWTSNRLTTLQLIVGPHLSEKFSWMPMLNSSLPSSLTSLTLHDNYNSLKSMKSIAPYFTQLQSLSIISSYKQSTNSQWCLDTLASFSQESCNHQISKIECYIDAVDEIDSVIALLRKYSSLKELSLDFYDLNESRTSYSFCTKDFNVQYDQSPFAKLDLSLGKSLKHISIPYSDDCFFIKRMADCCKSVETFRCKLVQDLGDWLFHLCVLLDDCNQHIAEIWVESEANSKIDPVLDEIAANTRFRVNPTDITEINNANEFNIVYCGLATWYSNQIQKEQRESQEWETKYAANMIQSTRLIQEIQQSGMLLNRQILEQYVVPFAHSIRHGNLVRVLPPTGLDHRSDDDDYRQIYRISHINFKQNTCKLTPLVIKLELDTHSNQLIYEVSADRTLEATSAFLLYHFLQQVCPEHYPIHFYFYPNS